MYQTQVSHEHYKFESYMSQVRWASIWHQINEVRKFAPTSILEIGPGSGLFQICCQHFRMSVETVDLDPLLNPTHIASATDLPFDDKSFDIVCAFQMLEHLEYEDSKKAFAEFARIAKSGVIISLPNAHPVWKIDLSVPFIPKIQKLIPHPHYRPVTHTFDGEHFWELGKKGYETCKVVGDFEAHAILLNEFRLFGNPYHHMMVYRPKDIVNDT